MQENPLEPAEGSVAPDFAMRDKHGKIKTSCPIFMVKAML